MKHTFAWGSFQANTFLYQARADSCAIKNETLVITSNQFVNWLKYLNVAKLQAGTRRVEDVRTNKRSSRTLARLEKRLRKSH